MSARNRELLRADPGRRCWSPPGSRPCSSSESDQLGDLSLIYGGYFLGLCLAAHIFLRIRLPDADPYLFPLVALLAAFGLVMIYRIDDEPRPRPGELVRRSGSSSSR